jgi:lipoate-protein ligase B
MQDHSIKQPEPECLIANLGLVDYKTAHQLQLSLLEARHAGFLENDIVLMLEHPPVFTLGRSYGRQNIIKDQKFLTSQGVDIVPIERGGDVTFHGPGQLVVYLLIDLIARGLDIRKFVISLEEVLIRTARDQDISASRDNRNIGVWANGDKLGSIGIAIRHGITFHGFALNVNIDLTPFQWIHPCGLKNVSMTSLSILKKAEVNMVSVCKSIKQHLQDVFHIKLKPFPPQLIERFISS